MNKQKIIIFYSVLISVFFLLTIILDRGLILFDLPSQKISHPPNYREKRTAPEFTYNFKTNRQGLRYREVPLKKSRNQFRMIMLGDSFTEGWGVEADETFSAIMERIAYEKKKDNLFINGGLASTSLQHYRDLLLHIGLKYHLDGVLVNIYANDLGEVKEKYNSGTKNIVGRTLYKIWPRIYIAIRKLSKKLNSTSLLKAPTHEMIIKKARNKGVAEERIQAWLDFLHEQTLISFEETLLIADRTFIKALLDPGYYVDPMEIHSEKHEKNWRKMADTLTEILEICQKNRIWMGLTYFPSYKQYDTHAVDFWKRAGINIPDYWLSMETEIEKRLHIWAKDNNVDFFNLTPVFQKTEKEVPYQFNYPADGHWNAAGHEFVAKLLYNWLSHLGIILH